MSIITAVGLASEAGSVPLPPLSAGTAKVDITPPPGIKMSGYGARKEGARGIHDPLLARVLVLKNKELSIAIVACDLVWLYSDNVVTEAKTKWGLDHVILCGSHTHSGPQMGSEPWRSEMEDKVIRAIGEAGDHLFPARISATEGSVNDRCFGYNRRVAGEDGSVTMWWSNPERKPNGPVDPTVRVIRIDDASDRPRVILVNFAAHPVTLGSGNLYLSADYPGVTVREIEKEFGAECMAMFLQGGGGDVHPYDSVMSGEAAFAAVENNGRSLATGVLQALKTMEPPVPTTDPSIKVKVRTLSMSYREDPEKTDDVGVMAVVINNEIALAVISGEPFVQHQLDLAAQSPLSHTLLLGYAWFGAGIPLRTYLPSLQATRDGGYGAAEGSANILEIGAGERMINAASTMIRELTARD